MLLKGKIKAVLFDSDGVLVDSERMYFEATRAAFEEAGAVLAPSDWARWYLSEFKSSRDIARLCGIDDAGIEGVLARRDTFFWPRVDQGVPLMLGAADAVRELSSRYRLAVVTGALRAHFERIHAASGLIAYFETVVAKDDYEQPKPHPDAYLTAMKRLNVRPHECVAVEDSPRGASSAMAAGIRCIVIPTQLTNRALCPDDVIIVPSMGHLAAAVNSMENVYEDASEII